MSVLDDKEFQDTLVRGLFGELSKSSPPRGLSPARPFPTHDASDAGVVRADIQENLQVPARPEGLLRISEAFDKVGYRVLAAYLRDAADQLLTGVNRR